MPVWGYHIINVISKCKNSCNHTRGFTSKNSTHYNLRWHAIGREKWEGKGKVKGEKRKRFIATINVKVQRHLSSPGPSPAGPTHPLVTLVGKAIARETSFLTNFIPIHVRTLPLVPPMIKASMHTHVAVTKVWSGPKAWSALVTGSLRPVDVFIL